MKTDHNHSLKNDNRTVVRGFRKSFIEFLILLNLVWILLRTLRNPLHLKKVVVRAIEIRRTFVGDKKISRIITNGKRYFWDMHSPGWPSRAFNHFYRDELRRIAVPGYRGQSAKLAVFSITNQCPLRCEHCYEAANLGKRDSLSLDDLKLIISRLKENGLTKIGLSGGEPMCRLDDILELVKTFRRDIDFWILTSGHIVTAENARKLKDAGVIGLSVSVDHYEEKKHNRFRGSEHAFQWSEEAIRNARAAGLLVCTTLCATREFTSKENLYRFAHLARQRGASFLQLVEPRAVGAYAGKDVTLQAEHIGLLEDFFLDVNYNKGYDDFPILAYHAYHQRRIGCIANANRYLFIDSFGNIHPCHFCRHNMGNLLSPEYMEGIANLRNFEGCKSFKNASLGFESLVGELKTA
jgi:MoaA/NifB/PqqE/SkfB family radical SAM enzyme